MDSLHRRLNSHYEAWSYKKKKFKKIKAYRKYVQREPAVKKCLVILDLKPLRSEVKGKHSLGWKFQSLTVRGKNFVIFVTSRSGERKIIQSIRITIRSPSRIRKWNQLSQFR